MIGSDFSQFGGKHTEVSALTNVLAHREVVAPHSGQSYSEELLFGIGGGIGFAYFLFEKNGKHPIHLGTRLHTKETERPEFFQNIAGRLAIPLTLQNSSSPTAAAGNLKRRLEQSETPIVWVDAARLSYLGLNTGLNTYCCVVAYGFDEAEKVVLLSDRCPKPVGIPEQELLTARETSWSPKYRAVVAGRPNAEPDVRSAVIEGIGSCCEQMNEGLGITNFGLHGLEKWATVLTSAKEKKSWPKIFSPGAPLYEALYSMFIQISGRSATGHANRAFYADFLDEAAEVLSNPGLRSAAQQYRHCDEVWRDVADAHLPSTAPIFAEAKDLTIHRRELFETNGPDTAAEIERIRTRLEEIAIQAGAEFPLSFQDSRALLNDLRKRVMNLRQAESDAVRELESAVRAGGAKRAPVSERVDEHQEEPEPAGHVG